MAHFNIGVAMARSGESDRSILAFETALRFHLNMVNAHRYLATLHRDNGGDSEKAAWRMRRRCGQSERLLRVGTNQTDRKETEATG
jgi:hypothetical protein